MRVWGVPARDKGEMGCLTGGAGRRVGVKARGDLGVTQRKSQVPSQHCTQNTGGNVPSVPRVGLPNQGKQFKWRDSWQHVHSQALCPLP